MLETLRRFALINSRTIFFSTLIIVPTLTLIVYLTGLHEHRSLYMNSLFSTTILSIIFLTFITTGLYKGWKQKDTMGNLLERLNDLRRPSLGSLGDADPAVIPADYGEAGCWAALLWLVLVVFGSLIFWAIGMMVWGTIVLFAAMLYWIFYRALRLILRNSPACKGNFWKSFGIGVLYTFLYDCWIYAIIFGTHFLRK